MKTLLTQRQIEEGVERVARHVAATYGPEPLTIVGILTGSLVFMSDLIRRLEMPLRLGFLSASSYRGETSRGQLVINSDLMPDVTDAHVLLVDDIFDTGHTLLKLTEMMRTHGTRSVRAAVLLQKRGRQEVDFQPDYVGFEIPDEFVVGYGMDFRDAYRNLPMVAALEPHEIEGPVPGTPV